MKKLTAKQIYHLDVLSHGARSAYPGLHMGVLNSLSLKGLVTATRGLGSMAMPRTSIKWQITDAGRASLAAPSTNGSDMTEADFVRVLKQHAKDIRASVSGGYSTDCDWHAANVLDYVAENLPEIASRQPSIEDAITSQLPSHHGVSK